MRNTTSNVLSPPSDLAAGAEARQHRPAFARRFSRAVLAAAALSVVTVGCGYSQEEWDQKVRENESLRNQLAAQRQARQKCETDYADALHQVEELKKRLKERGIDLDSMSADLAQTRKALEEYQRRAEQLDQIRKRFELLRTKLKKLTDLGLKVEVRDNRMLIQLPGDVLFDSGQESLKKEGIEILRQVADVIRNDKDLNSREFQVAGHTDAKPFAGTFKDNWGLSAMRARSVLKFLTDASEKGGGLEPKNWSAAGYADTDPVATNDTDDGRKKNRRVELVVQPNVEEMLNLNSLATP
jgi:chemotaxis protein MotB